MVATREIKLNVNGIVYPVQVRVSQTLLDVLRDTLGLTGTKEGCATGDCGACTVLLEGEPVNSCLVLAVEANGKSILTVEGLAHGDQLDPLQEAFVREGAVQCGFCSPGMLMTGKALLAENSHPSEPEVRQAIAGNLCRCTGYVRIVQAILKAGETPSGRA